MPASLSASDGALLGVSGSRAADEPRTAVEAVRPALRAAGRDRARVHSVVHCCSGVLSCGELRGRQKRAAKIVPRVIDHTRASHLSAGAVL